VTTDHLEDLPKLATLKDEEALSTDPSYKAALDRVGVRPDALAWLPPGCPLLEKLPVTQALLTATMTPQAFSLQLDAPLKDDAPGLAALTPKDGGADLLGLLPRDAFLVVRFEGDPTALAPYTNTLLGPHLSRAFSEGGLDLKTEVLEKLKPGAVVSLSLAPRPPMDRGLPSFDIRQTNPFSYAQLAGAAPVDPAGADETLSKVASLAPRFGAEMKKVERDGKTTFLTSYSQGEGVHFARKDGVVVFASPVQRLDELLHSDGKGGSPVPGLGDGALALTADLVKLAGAVRELPSDAWGIGGFAIKATTVRWLDATDDLKAVSLTLSAKDKTLSAKVVLALGAPQAKKAP